MSPVKIIFWFRFDLGQFYLWLFVLWNTFRPFWWPWTRHENIKIFSHIIIFKLNYSDSILFLLFAAGVRGLFYPTSSSILLGRMVLVSMQEMINYDMTEGHIISLPGQLGAETPSISTRKYSIRNTKNTKINSKIIFFAFILISIFIVQPRKLVNIVKLRKWNFNLRSTLTDPNVCFRFYQLGVRSKTSIQEKRNHGRPKISEPDANIRLVYINLHKMQNE